MPEKKINVVFMYAGQGSHYANMAKELYFTDESFKKTLDDCSRKVSDLTGEDLVKAIFTNMPNYVFDNILQTHLAIFSIAYSITKLLSKHDIHPDAVIGYSLGEYIALNSAGCLSLDDSLRLAAKQAQLCKKCCGRGGLLSVLAPVDQFYQRGELFSQVTLAGVNFSECFFVSGAHKALLELKSELDERGIVSILLPVNYGFHSSEIDAIEREFKQFVSNIVVHQPVIPVYSSVCARKLNLTDFENFPDYLWDVVRKKINFNELIELNFHPKEDYFFSDLSATGTLFNFIKYLSIGDVDCGFVINQFGKNIETLNTFINQINRVRQKQ